MATERSNPPPPPDAPQGPPGSQPERPSARPSEGGGRESERRALADLLRRGLEAGRGTLEKNLGESFFPRDAAAQLVSSIGDLKQGVVAAVAQEVGRFLRQADIAAEIRQVLTGLEIDAHVHLSFRESGQGGVSTEVDLGDVRTSARKRRGRDGRPSSPPPDADDGVSDE